jgi:hypothetical protein
MARSREERIDALADRLLKTAKYEGVPATEVWDTAAEVIDRRGRGPENFNAQNGDYQAPDDYEREA